ncbi:putative disease resistance RPP13-like protein 3 [Rhododendron vialii]|uniref:putative disease resistance RPP13-like protein 3 n=1 Tax=Rhododendron vialii TaxID=182163 RepID=UPI00265F71E6|nr:putative disease resistance RPP13-like protein 3 [Rhododendron vialii]
MVNSLALVDNDFEDADIESLFSIEDEATDEAKFRSTPSNPDEDLQFAFWTSRNNRSHPNSDGSITWRKAYHTIFLSAYPVTQGKWIDSGNYLVITRTLCSLNGLALSDPQLETKDKQQNSRTPEREMAETIAHSLMENLEELMSFKRDLIREEEDQIAWLYKDLQLLIAFLKDLQIKFKDHEGAKNLEARIRDVVYEAETAVDLFIVNTAWKEKEDIITKRMEEIGISEKTGHDRSLNLGHVKKEIEAIKTEVNKMYDKRTQSVQMVNNVEIFSIDRDASRATNNSKCEGEGEGEGEGEEETMVGFEQETMILKEQLTGGSKQLKIISIVGMAGLGKTTLATRVYKDPLVAYYFYMRAWISVSQEYRKRDLLLGLLSCNNQISNPINDEVLPQSLYKSLKGRRYFILMDGIWDYKAWFDLENCFPDDNNGSRIMFTSRHEHVAFSPFSLRFLSLDESWNLLRQKIFQRETCPSELMETGKQIAQKCKGLPLAIVVVAGILRNEEKSQERWKQVGQTLNSHMAMDQELWTKTIALSYNHLPPHLKPCFLYFAIFPEDYQILVWKLIWLWVAEGFIRKTGEKILEDVAEEYLKDLISRSLVLVSRRG